MIKVLMNVWNFCKKEEWSVSDMAIYTYIK